MRPFRQGSTRALGDDLLVRRTSRGLALQGAALVGTAMLLLIGLVTLVVVHEQETSGDALLRTTAATADDVGDPPAGAFIVLVKATGTQSSPGLPVGLAEDLADKRNRPGITTLRDDDGIEYRVLTTHRGAVLVQVALDLRPQHAERHRLFRVMGVATALALLAAGGLGVLLSRRAVRPLADALALQRTFVADASHELRTPLTLLSTRVQVLDAELRRSVVDPRVLEDSSGVVSDVSRLGDVVEDLLVAADQRRDDEHAPVDLGALAQAVMASATAHATAASVVLSTVVVDASAVVTGSSAALRRAVLALVDNAIDHTPPGGQVTVRVERERRGVVLAVSDTGPGIAPEAVDGLFRRFHSGGHRSGRAHYGLGLALTHDVANRHGGELRLAATSPGAGTTFELVLPV